MNLNIQNEQKGLRLWEDFEGTHNKLKVIPSASGPAGGWVGCDEGWVGRS